MTVSVFLTVYSQQTNAHSKTTKEIPVKFAEYVPS